MDIIPYSNEHKIMWDEYLKKNPKSSIFHTIEWKNIIEKVYKFRPYYFLAINNDEVKGVLCSFLTKGFLGEKIVSTPFNFYNPPLFDDEEAENKLIEHIILLGKDKNVDYVEIKSLEKLDEKTVSCLNLQKKEHYFISNLKLTQNPEEKYYPNLRKNLRTLVRNAEKEHMTIRDFKNEKDLKQFYHIMVTLYRDKHQMMPQPYAFFYEMYQTFGKNFNLLVAEHNNKVIAGMLLLFFKNQVVYAYGSSDQRYRALSPGTLLIDETIKRTSKMGYENMDFGVTSPYQESLLEYKSNWGAESSKMPYYYALIKLDKVPELDYYTSYKNIRKYFRYMPIELIKIVSPFVTRKIG